MYMMRSSRQAVQTALTLSRRSNVVCRGPPKRFLSEKAAAPKHAKTTAGTGRVNGAADEFSRHRGPVSWAALGLVAVASASAVGYFQVERERRLERAMGKVVSSTYRNGTEEEDCDGWSPNPEFLAKRKWKLTKFGWFPEEDAFGGGELDIMHIGNQPISHQAQPEASATALQRKGMGGASLRRILCRTLRDLNYFHIIYLTLSFLPLLLIL